MKAVAYLSLGSNVGDRSANLREGIRRVENLGHLTSVSSFYETEPIEFTDQAWFLNCAVAIEIEKTPQDLMQALMRIEKDMGRQRVQNKGPRVIDIDIVLFDDIVVNTSDLAIPHPAMHQRRFVLEPLAEIAPEVRHPLLGRSVRQLVQELPAGQTVRKTD